MPTVMSPVLTWSSREAVTNDLSENSLLDFLFTYSTISQLNAMLISRPNSGMLEMWGVSCEEYLSIVRTAIYLIDND